VASLAPDSALTELVEEGVNGAVAASPAPADLASALGRVLSAGPPLRASTSRWWDRHRDELSARASIDTVREVHRAALSAGRGSLS
jgi:hypothetical protein